MYPVWKAEDVTADDFSSRLLDELAPALLDNGVRGLRIATVDSAVDAAAPMRLAQLCPALDGMLSLWVDSAINRAGLEALIAGHCASYCGYAVLESTPLVGEESPGQRVPGMHQVVFLQRPPRLDRESWLQIWLEEHTAVAVATQSNFAYRQNVVVRALTEAAPDLDAIVEETFPAAAMTSQQAFYGVESDNELEQRRAAMMASCARFIDFDRLNVTPTSDYLIRSLAGAL